MVPFRDFVEIAAKTIPVREMLCPVVRIDLDQALRDGPCARRRQRKEERWIRRAQLDLQRDWIADDDGRTDECLRACMRPRWTRAGVKGHRTRNAEEVVGNLRARTGIQRAVE